jgi:hypothetical protein
MTALCIIGAIIAYFAVTIPLAIMLGRWLSHHKDT